MQKMAQEIKNARIEEQDKSALVLKRIKNDFEDRIEDL
jgi:hypothetical protein